MLKNDLINIQVVEMIAKALGDLNKDVIYIGGAVVSLYITDTGADQPRSTKDIDVSVQVSSYNEMDKLRVNLATKDIYPASSEEVMYRYSYKDVLIDFIPFEATSLGPTNSWLKPGFKKAYEIEVGEQQIKILPVSLFLATKWEAYKVRGGNDPRTSHDFEDIIYVIDNNLEVVEDIRNANEDVQIFLKEMAVEILEHNSKHEIVECHINPFTAEERALMVIDKLELIKAL